MQFPLPANLFNFHLMQVLLYTGYIVFKFCKAGMFSGFVFVQFVFEYSPFQVVYQILLEWIRVNASDARLGELTNALWKSAEYSAVKKLAEWAKESSLF